MKRGDEMITNRDRFIYAILVVCIVMICIMTVRMDMAYYNNRNNSIDKVKNSIEMMLSGESDTDEEALLKLLREVEELEDIIK